jgi:hypothetical protein
MLKAPKNITLPPGLQRACLCLATGGRAADPASRLRDFSQRRRADAGVWCPRGLACCLPSCRPPGLPSRHPPSRPPSLRPPGVPEAPVGLLPPVPAVRPSRRPSACCLPFPPSVGLLPPVPAVRRSAASRPRRLAKSGRLGIPEPKPETSGTRNFG